MTGTVRRQGYKHHPCRPRRQAKCHAWHLSCADSKQRCNADPSPVNAKRRISFALWQTQRQEASAWPSCFSRYSCSCLSGIASNSFGCRSRLSVSQDVAKCAIVFGRLFDRYCIAVMREGVERVCRLAHVGDGCQAVAMTALEKQRCFCIVMSCFVT